MKNLIMGVTGSAMVAASSFFGATVDGILLLGGCAVLAAWQILNLPKMKPIRIKK